jgi:hypothetical protein
MRQAGLFGLSDHLKRLSAYGDPLEELVRIVDFEVFRPALVAALAYAGGHALERHRAPGKGVHAIRWSFVARST